MHVQGGRGTREIDDAIDDAISRGELYLDVLFGGRARCSRSGDGYMWQRGVEIEPVCDRWRAVLTDLLDFIN